jgi:hypothetical protein
MAGRLWIAVTVAIVALGASILPSLLNPFDASDLQGAPYAPFFVFYFDVRLVNLSQESGWY